MTRPAHQIERALAMRAQGLSPGRIGQRLSIPRRTIHDWISGRVPNSRPLGIEYCEKCGGAAHRLEELPPSYVYLLGLYLGDGCISSHPRDVYKLRLFLDPAYPKIVEEAADAMRKVMPSSKTTWWRAPNRTVEVYSHSKGWPCLFPQHGPGKKHLRPIVLSGWQEELVRKTPELLLRGLIHSDGCRFMNTGRAWRHPRYSFTNLSPDIRRIFTDACGLVGLHWTTSGHIVYVSRKADVARMDSFIGPKA